MPENEAPVLETGEELSPVNEVVPEKEPPAEKPSEAAPETDPKPKKSRGGFQSRIDRLTREKYEAEARARDAEAKLQTQAQPGEPERDQFESYEDFVVAKAAYKAEEKTKSIIQQERDAARQQQFQQSEAEIESSWLQRVDSARDKYDDYDEITNTDVPVTQAMMRAMKESEHGADIAYYLGNNPAEADRILKLTPGRQFIEIGKLELKVQAPKKQTSGAPNPITPVKGTGGADTITPDDKDDKKWLERRYKQLGRKWPY